MKILVFGFCTAPQDEQTQRRRRRRVHVRLHLRGQPFSQRHHRSQVYVLICERLCHFQGHARNIAAGHNNTFLFLIFSKKTAPVTSSAGTSHVTRGPVTFERLCWLLAEDGVGWGGWGGGEWRGVRGRLVGLGWEGSGRPWHLHLTERRPAQWQQMVSCLPDGAGLSPNGKIWSASPDVTCWQYGGEKKSGFGHKHIYSQPDSEPRE